MISIVWDFLCLALLWSIFGRSVRTDQTTVLPVRLSMWAVGLAALLGLGAPMYEWEPDIVIVLILFPLVLMQFVMSNHWRYGVPAQYVKCEFLSSHIREEETRCK